MAAMVCLSVSILSVAVAVVAGYIGTSDLPFFRSTLAQVSGRICALRTMTSDLAIVLYDLSLADHTSQYFWESCCMIYTVFLSKIALVLGRVGSIIKPRTATNATKQVDHTSPLRAKLPQG
eukprot:3171368-Amphidinium_carterae.1